MQHPKSPSTNPLPVPDVPRAHSTFAPLFIWLLIQLIALGVSTARIPFYAKGFPQPAELLASNVMLIVQIGASAMLFLFLLRDLWAAGIVIAASWPFTIVGGFLTGLMDPWLPIEAAGYVTLWLLGLAVWRSILRSPRAQAGGIAVAMLAAFGGPLAWYLRAEFGNSNGGSPDLWGPIFGALAVANHGMALKGPWMVMGGFLTAGILGRCVQWIASRR